MDSILKDYIRPYDPIRDKNLKEFSHSRIECYTNCAYQFKLKYIDEKTTSDTTIALTCGSLAHKVLELKGLMLKEDKPIDYEYLMDILENGYPEESIIGRKEIQKRFWEEYATADTEGNTYAEKFKTFEKILHTEMEDSDWVPWLFEQEFHFVYKDRIHIKGFIDRVDKCGDELRVVDYKTSKKVFDEAKNKTAQQMAIYNMALLCMYGQMASKSIYRFIFIDKEQSALSDGWEGRIIKKLDKIFDQIDECEESGIYAPHPSPLCHFCQYCVTNSKATKYKNECQYYMKWTRSNKDFSVNKEWNPNVKDEPKRKLKFDF